MSLPCWIIIFQFAWINFFIYFIVALRVSTFKSNVIIFRYKATGIRLDSGDLAYLSIESRKFFQAIEKEFGVSAFGKMMITASNDLNEDTLDALKKQVSFNLIPIYE